MLWNRSGNGCIEISFENIMAGVIVGWAILNGVIYFVS